MRIRTWLGIGLLALAGCGGEGGGSAPEGPASVTKGWGHPDATYGRAGVAEGIELAGHFAVGCYAFGSDGSAFAIPSAHVVKLDARAEPVATYRGETVALLDGEYATDIGIDAAGWIYVGTMRRNPCADHPPAGSVGAIHKLSSD